MIDVSTSTPLSALDSRIGEMLLRGTRERFSIQAASEREAIRFTFMIHTYRKRMKKHHGTERPEMWEPLYGAVVSRRGATITISPRSAQFDSLFSQLPAEGEASLGSQQGPTIEGAADLLADLKAEQEGKS